MKIIYLITLMAIITSACTKTAKVIYPETKKENVTDTYFGTEVADPYRWLEDDNSPETAEWVKAQNEVTFAYLNQEFNTGDLPVLIRIETKAGHGAGKPTAKIIEEHTDIWSFTMYHLGMSL
jgi:prolyl oligopeptidase PreP (S9A serine peptidase family)